MEYFVLYMVIMWLMLEVATLANSKEFLIVNMLEIYEFSIGAIFHYLLMILFAPVLIFIALEEVPSYYHPRQVEELDDEDLFDDMQYIEVLKEQSIDYLENAILGINKELDKTPTNEYFYGQLQHSLWMHEKALEEKVDEGASAIGF